MLKIMAFLTKREDIETQAFSEYDVHQHVPLLRSTAYQPAERSTGRGAGRQSSRTLRKSPVPPT